MSKLELTGKGSDPAAIKKTVDGMNADIAKVKEEMARELPNMPTMKPIMELMNSVELACEGGQATLTPNLPTGAQTAYAMIFFGMSSARSIPAEPAELPPPAPEVVPEEEAAE